VKVALMKIKYSNAQYADIMDILRKSISFEKLFDINIKL